MATPHSDDNLARRLATDLDPASEGAIRTVLETLKQDAIDPIPTSALARAAGLATELPRPPSWLETFDRLAARVMAPLFDDGPALAHGLRGDDLRQCTLAVDDLRLDLEIEADAATVDDPNGARVGIRAQIDAERGLEGPVEIAVFRADTDRMVVETRSDDCGRFDLNLVAGRYDLLFRLPDGCEARGVIEVP
jgi:hypothetical protein